MQTQWLGVVADGAIVLDGGAHLPEGTRVEVRVAETVAPASLAETLLRHAGKAVDLPDDAAAGHGRPRSSLGERLLKHVGTVDGLPDDLASQHDHYVHGTPKR